MEDQISITTATFNTDHPSHRIEAQVDDMLTTAKTFCTKLHEGLSAPPPPPLDTDDLCRLSQLADLDGILLGITNPCVSREHNTPSHVTRVAGI